MHACQQDRGTDDRRWPTSHDASHESEKPVFWPASPRFALLERFENDPRRFFDGAPADVYDGPFRVTRKESMRVVELLFDLVAEAVSSIRGHPELLQARAANFHQVVQRNGEPHDEHTGRRF